MTTPNLVKTEEMPELEVGEDRLAGNTDGERKWRMYYDIATPAPAYADILYPPTTGFTIVGNPVPVVGVPDNGVLYPTKRKAVRDLDDERIWILTVGFVNPKPQDKQDQANGTTKFNVKISMTSVPFQENVHEDANGKTIRICTGEMVDPPLQRIYYDKQWNMSYHVASPDWATLDGCLGACNNANVTLTINGANKIFANGTLKLDSYAFDADVSSNGTAVCQVNLSLLEHDDGWLTKVVNKSFQKLVSGGITSIKWDECPNPPASNTTLKGTDVDQPQYLSADGTTVLGANQTVTFSNFTLVPKVDFTSLLNEIHT